MRFSTLLLAEHASLINGLISILNGGVNRVSRPAFPASLGLYLVGIVELAEDYKDGQQVRVSFTVTSPDESEVFGRAEGGFATALVPGADRKAATVPVVIDLRGVPLTKAGLYKVSATLDEEVAQSLFFEVVKVDQPATSVQLTPQPSPVKGDDGPNPTTG
jgi:hypothetical protein